MEFIPIIVVGVVMYAVLILPQQRRNREHKSLIQSLEVGDEVVNNAGIYGFIAAIDNDILWLEVAEGVELKISKNTVANKVVLKDDTGVDDTGMDADDDAESEKS